VLLLLRFVASCGLGSDAPEQQLALWMALQGGGPRNARHLLLLLLALLPHLPGVLLSLRYASCDVNSNVPEQQLAAWIALQDVKPQPAHRLLRMLPLLLLHLQLLLLLRCVAACGVGSNGHLAADQQPAAWTALQDGGPHLAPSLLLLQLLLL